MSTYLIFLNGWLNELNIFLMRSDSTWEGNIQLVMAIASTLSISYTRNIGRAGLGLPYVPCTLCITHSPSLYLQGNSWFKKLFVAIQGIEIHGIMQWLNEEKAITAIFLTKWKLIITVIVLFPMWYLTILLNNPHKNIHVSILPCQYEILQ